MAVIGIARISYKQVAAFGDGFTDTGMQLAGGRIDKTQLQLGMFFNPNRAPLGADAIFQVIAMRKRIVFKT